MSSSVDNRIVKLGFDNAKFEAGVSQSMKTIDKLENALQFKGAEKGFENLQRDVDGVDFSPMMKGIETLEKRFSVMGIATMNVVNKITDSMINGAKKLEAATIGQIKSGGWSRAMNLANAKFQIEGLKEDWTEMEKAISYGVKDTAYGLDAAATAASSLVASGVAYKESIEGANDSLMHTALRGISGVAAMTNSSYEDISRIFTTVAGNGRLMGDQLLQLSSRGMNAAATLATALGKTEAEIRDMVSHGQIDFKTFATAMDDAFGAHAKDANKTFTGSLSNMKAALSRFGAVFATPIIGKTNTLFISITKQIDVLKKKLDTITVPRGIDELQKKAEQFGVPATGYSAMVKELGDKTIKLGEDFANMWDAGINAFSKLITSIDLSWFDKIVEKVDNVVVKIKEIFEALDEYLDDSSEEVSEGVNDAAQSLKVSAEEVAAAKDIIEKGMYGFGAARHKALVELFGGDAEAEQHAKNVQAYINSVVAAGYDYDKAAIKMEESSEAVIQSVEDVEKAERKTNLKKTFDNIKKTLSNLFTVAKNLGKSAGKILNSAFGSFKKVFNIKTGSFSTGVESVSEALAKFSEKLIISDKTASRLGKIFEFFFSVIKKGGSVLINAGKQAGNFVTEFKKSDAFGWISEKFDGFVTTVKNSDIFNWIVDKIKDLLDTSKDFDAFGKIKDFFLDMADAIYNNTVFDTIKTKISGVSDSISKFALPEWVTSNSLFSGISKFFEEIGKIASGTSNLPTKLTLMFNKIIEALSKVEWDKLKQIGYAILAFLAVQRIVGILGGMSSLVNAASAVPAKIASLFEAIGKMFSTSADALLIAAKAYRFKILADAILQLGIVVVALAMMDSQKMYQGLTAVIVLSLVLVGLMKAVKKTTEGSIGGGNKFTANVKQLVSINVGMLGLAMAVAGLAAALGAIAALIKVIDSVKPENFTLVMLNVVGILSAVIVISFFMTGLIKVIQKSLEESAKKAWEALPAAVSLAIVIAAYVAALLGVVAAVMLLAAIPIDRLDPAVNAMTTIMVALGIVLLAIGTTVALVTHYIGGINYKVLLSMAVLVIAISAALAIVVGAITAMAVLMTANDEGWLSLTDAINAVLTVFGAIVTAIMLIAFAAKTGGSYQKGLTTTILAITAFVGVIALSLYKLAGVVNDNTLAIANKIALIIVSVAGAILAIILAFGIYNKISSSRAHPADMLMGIAIAFVGIAAALYIMAAAIKTLSSASDGVMNLVIMVGVLTAFVLIMSLMSAIFGDNFFKALTTLSVFFISLGVAALAVGAGMYLVGAGIAKLNESLIALAPSLHTILEELNDHSGLLFMIGIFVVAILGLVVLGIVELMSVIKPIVELITKSLVTIIEALSSFSNKADKETDKMGTKLTAKSKAIIIGIIAGLIGAIITMTPEMLNALGQMIIKILAWLGSIAGDIAMGLVEFLINIINGVADAIRLNSAGIANAIFNVIYALASLVLEVLHEFVKMLGLEELVDSMLGFFGVDGGFAGVDNVLNQFVDARRKEAQAIDQAKKEAHDAALGIEKSSTATSTSILGSVGSSIKGLFGLGSASEDTASKVSGSFNAMSKSATEYMEVAMSTSHLTTEAMRDLRNSGFGDALDNGPAAARDAALRAQMDKTAYNRAKAGITTASSENGVAGATAFSGSYTDTLGANLPDSMTDVLTSGDMTGAGIGAGSYLGNITGDTTADSFTSTMVDNESRVTDTVQDSIVDPATDTLEESRTDFEASSKYAIRGWLDGIDKNTPAVVGQMADLVGKMKNRIETELDINSPSKVFYGYGKYITEGLANGISETTKRASISMDELADTVLISFGAPLDYLGKIASGELIYDTTIRPVVDTSRISGSARSINGMLNTQTIQLSGFSGQLAADMTRLDNSNAAVVSELKQLREDMAAMTEEISNMQMVMDTGALVGQISGPIDRSLGRSMVRKGRGN